MRLGTTDFVGERLRESREARGLAGSTLAELLGVSRQAVSQYEKNQQTPSPPVMERICAVLRLPRDYFTRRSQEKLGALFFRSYASATKAERNRQSQRQKWRRRVVGFLGRYVEYPGVQMPLLFDGAPSSLEPPALERLAVTARRAFGLSDGPISDLVLMLESLGAIVVRTEFNARSLDAFSEWSPDDERPYFVLNADKRAAVRSRFDAAHELAHVLLHRRCQVPSDPQLFKMLETQAHRFGGAFLAPADAFRRAFRRTATLDDLVEQKRIWKMSISAIARRAWDLELVNAFRYRRMMTEIGSRGWRTWEPLDSETACEEPRLLRRSVDLVLQGQVVHAGILERVGAGSVRDVEEILGLPEGYLGKRLGVSGETKLKTQTRATVAERVRIIRLTDHLK